LQGRVDSPSEFTASPAVLTGEAESARDGSVSLSGMVHPNGSSTAFYFQWGEGPSPAATRVVGLLDRDTEARVKIPSRELRPGTTYRYRLVATNSFGTTMGAERSFTTDVAAPPRAITGRAKWLDAAAVTLTGSVNAGPEPMGWFFEYGQTMAYGVTSRGGVIDGEQTRVAVSEPITDLVPGTSFHYRLVARRGTMVLRGEDAVFVTPVTPSLAGRLRSATHGRRGAPALARPTR
jgi:phosphodiesterase/alkaline phosphatase D-like protein